MLWVVSVVPFISGCFKLVSLVSESFWLLKSSRLFSLFPDVLDSVMLLTFSRMSSVVHVVQLDVESFRLSCLDRTKVGLPTRIDMNNKKTQMIKQRKLCTSLSEMDSSSADSAVDFSYLHFNFRFFLNELKKFLASTSFSPAVRLSFHPPFPLVCNLHILPDLLLSLHFLLPAILILFCFFGSQKDFVPTSPALHQSSSPFLAT